MAPLTELAGFREAVSLAPGLDPQLKVDTAASGAVGQAGGVPLTETIAASGLGRELSQALVRWRKPLAIHDPAKVITDLAVTLALGGDCMADIALLRAEPGFYGRVASDATLSRTIDDRANSNNLSARSSAPRHRRIAGHADLSGPQPE